MLLQHRCHCFQHGWEPFVLFVVRQACHEEHNLCISTLHIKIKAMVHSKRYKSMDLLLELLLELLLVLLLELLLYVPFHVDTREPSCNAQNKMEL